MNIPSNLKLITSGTVPNTSTLSKGEMAFGKVPASGEVRVFVNDDDSVTELPLGGEPYVLPAATGSALGGVKVGSGLSVTNDGTLAATSVAIGSLKTNNTAAQTASSGESFSGNINLHKVSKTGNYNDLLNKPTVPAAFTGSVQTSDSAQTKLSSATSLNAAVTLHSVARTGNYNDLLNKPSIPDVNGYLPTSGGTLTGNLRIQSGNYGLGINLGDGDYVRIFEPTDDKLEIQATQGIRMNTKNSIGASGQVLTSDGDTTYWGDPGGGFSGDYNDLTNKPTLPAAFSGTVKTSDSAQTKLSSATSLNAAVTLHSVARTGSYTDLLNKPSIPSVGDGTVTIQQGGATKGSFSVNQSGNTTISLDGGAGGISTGECTKTNYHFGIHYWTDGRIIILSAYSWHAVTIPAGQHEIARLPSGCSVAKHHHAAICGVADGSYIMISLNCIYINLQQERTFHSGSGGSLVFTTVAPLS
jgi:hypothetical protein